MSSHRRSPAEKLAAFARLRKETLVPVEDVVDYVHTQYGGAFGLVSRNILIRSAISGKVGADGVRVFLDAAVIKDVWRTSIPAVTRFLRALAERTKVTIEVEVVNQPDLRARNSRSALSITAESETGNSSPLR